MTRTRTALVVLGAGVALLLHQGVTSSTSTAQFATGVVLLLVALGLGGQRFASWLDYGRPAQPPHDRGMAIHHLLDDDTDWLPPADLLTGKYATPVATKTRA